MHVALIKRALLALARFANGLLYTLGWSDPRQVFQMYAIKLKYTLRRSLDCGVARRLLEGL